MTIPTVTQPGTGPDRVQAPEDYDQQTTDYRIAFNTTVGEFNTAVNQINFDLDEADTQTSTAVQAAQDARDLAQAYANQAEDTEVVPGEFSALHFAAKALADADRSDTEADRSEDARDAADSAALLAGAATPIDLSTADINDTVVIKSDGSGGKRFETTPFLFSTFEEFTASGTWTKPDNLAFVRVEVVGAGGGGRQAVGSNDLAGGGGGAYNTATFRASYLGATETITVGAGGSPEADGGDTLFGSMLIGRGGKGVTNTLDTASGDYSGNLEGYFAGAGITRGVGGRSVKGGAGGGGIRDAFDDARVGGVSDEGGNGGDGSYAGTAQNGEVPGGGGGSSGFNGTPGSGANGRVRVWTW